MGCNCGKARNKLKNLVQQQKVISSVVSVVQVPVTPAALIVPGKTRRQLRIEARNKRIADRNAAILARKAVEDAKKLGN